MFNIIEYCRRYLGMEKLSVHISVSPANLIVVGVCTAILTALKVTGYIDWSWVWVLAPLWLDLILLVTMIIVIFIWYKVIIKNK